jgi:transposase
MLTQTRERLKAEGKNPDNISLLARETKLSRDTIRKYLKEGVQPHKNAGKKKSSKLDPYKGYLREQFEYGNYNCEALLDRLKVQGYTGGITILREYVRDYRPDPEKRSVPGRTQRFETLLGEQVQMDWGFVTYQGKTKKKGLACLAMILGASRQRYVEFFTSARQENLFIGMIHAFQYFEGLPKTVLTDNMKSVVQSRNRQSIIMNPKYEVFMAELGFATRLCKVRTPQTKGKSERLVDYVKDNFFPGRTFTHLVDLNLQALRWCEHVNGKVHGTTGLIPAEVHETEKRHLRALPAIETLDRYLWVYRSVNLDGMVSYEGSKYGIIHTCRDKRVRITRNGGQILILGSDGSIVGEYQIADAKKMYYHAQQWPDDYVRDNGRGRRNYGFAKQTDGQQTFPFSESSDLSPYDSAAGGDF